VKLIACVAQCFFYFLCFLIKLGNNFFSKWFWSYSTGWVCSSLLFEVNLMPIIGYLVLCNVLNFTPANCVSCDGFVVALREVTTLGHAPKRCNINYCRHNKIDNITTSVICISIVKENINLCIHWRVFIFKIVWASRG
jgi:hypothetical protein